MSLWIGLEEKYNECPTYGWTCANLEIVQARKTLFYHNPPVNDGEKIVFADSDHINPYGRDNIWV